MRKTGALLLLVCLVGRATEPVAGPLRFSEVYLCFAEEHAADLVSGFGHAFVCLPERPAQSADELLAAPAVNFAADTSGAGEGMWQARFRVRSCHDLLRTNTFFQQRDVYFIRLRLDEDARRRLSDGLSRRMEHPFPYDFFRSNCGAHLADWILTEAGHPDSVPRPWLYITPRECIERIVNTVGAEGILVSRSSASRVAARAEQIGAEGVSQARAAVHDPRLTADITDPWLRLEVIRLNESRVDPDKYKELQALRRRTLEGPGGTEAAKSMGRTDNTGLKPMSIWTRSEEGPAVALAGLSDTDGRCGLRIGLEAGLRDTDTAPRNNEARREAHLLGIEIDRLGAMYRTKATFAAMHNMRNLPGIFGGGSSGFEIGYIDRPNQYGTHGIHLETWSGSYMRLGDSTWMGARLSVRGDDIQADTRIRLLPTVDLSTQLGVIGLSGSLTSAQGDFGHRVEARTRLGTASLGLSMERSPEGDERLSLGVSQRF